MSVATRPQQEVGHDQNSPYNATFPGIKGGKNRGNANLISMFGKQPLSHRKSSEYAKFGTSTRDQTQKMFISKDHSKQGFGKNSPGPVYDRESSLGKQWASEKETVPTWGFGTVDRSKLGNKEVHAHSANPDLNWAGAYPGPGKYETTSSIGKQVSSKNVTSKRPIFGTNTRDKLEKVYNTRQHEDHFMGKGSPGPGTYNHKSSVGKQAYAVKETAPTPKFGTANRFKYEYEERARLLPGPEYKHATSVGVQTLSKNQTGEKYGFGTTERDMRNKMFISREHEKSVFGREGPGPQKYEWKSSIGKQVKSEKLSVPSYGFGTETRFKMNFNGGNQKPFAGPGPGQYNY